MNIGIIELNDTGIRYAPADGDVIESPGFAVVNGKELLLGQQALEQSRIHPINTNNQFWHRLSAEPLPIDHEQYRHHADLAYSQLLSLHRQNPASDQIVFALPGSFTREQMSLLLGIASQCPFTAVGLADSAVAASTPAIARNQALFVDLQLHQIVFTKLVVDDQVRRQQVDFLPRVGLLAMRDRWAKFLADQFVEQTRFDPLHSAVTEQSLYDRMPYWLERAQTEPDLFVEVADKTAKISRDQLMAPMQEMYRQILDKARQLAEPETELLFSDRFAQLPGLAQQLDNLAMPAKILESRAVLDGIRDNLEQIVSRDGNLSFVQSLTPRHKPAAAQPVSTEKSPTPATHLLAGSTAYALGPRPLYLNDQADDLVSTVGRDNDIARIERHGDDIRLLPLGDGVRINETAVSDNTRLQLNDRIHLGGRPDALRLIRVLGDDGS